MTTDPPDRLDGWKQIADYLDKSVKTCQNWEREQGLPIHRLHGNSGRATVFAFRAEIDQWLLSGGSAEARGRATRRRRRIVAVLGLGGLLIAAAWLLGPAARRPVVESVVIDNDLMFAAISPTGERLWTHVDEEPFITALGQKPAARAMDLDGNGEKEVLAAFKRHTPGRDEVRTLDASGSLLWRLPVGVSDLVINGEAYRDSYSLWDVVVLDTAAGPRIAVISKHTPWFPSLVQWLDAETGRLLGTYVHTGYLFASVAHDLDGDGSQELVAAGYNNLLQSPVVVVLEPIAGTIVSPGPEGWQSAPRPERNYLRLERSLTGAVLGTASWIRRVEVHDDVLRVDVHLEGDDEREERIYLLDRDDLSLVRVEIPRAFRAYHGELLDAGRISHSFEQEEQNALILEHLVPRPPDHHSRLP